MYKANAYLVRIIILNVTLSVVYKGSRTALMSYNSKVTFWTLCDGYFTVGNACLNETGLLFSLSFTGAPSPRISHGKVWDLGLGASKSVEKHRRPVCSLAIVAQSLLLLLAYYLAYSMLYDV